jgi:hypothetical protein
MGAERESPTAGGFTSYIGFVPQHDLGLVVLNAMNPGPTGSFFSTYVLNVLLNQRLSLNLGVPAKPLAANAGALDQQRQLGKQAKGVDRKAVSRDLGCYEGGYSLVLDGRDLVLRLGHGCCRWRSCRTGATSSPVASSSALRSGWVSTATGYPTSTSSDSRPCAARRARSGAW